MEEQWRCGCISPSNKQLKCHEGQKRATHGTQGFTRTDKDHEAQNAKMFIWPLSGNL